MSVASNDAGQAGDFSLKRVLAVAIPAVLIGLVIAVAVPRRIEENARQEADDKVIDRLGLKSAVPGLLDSRFDDADGDLLADPPKDTRAHVTPDKLIFSYIGGPEAEAELDTWKEFVAHLSQATGVAAEAVAFNNTADQLLALNKGALHVSGFNTGSVSTAVTMCGFVPFCTYGSDDGRFGSSMKVIVPVDSAVKSLAELKGRTVTFTLMDSNSGCKAAIVLLKEYNLLPERDYKWRFSGSHQESIKRVISGEHEAAPVSDDLLHRALAENEGDAEKIRVIYESERFPPATIGHVYNLSPELAEKVRRAFLDYPWKDTQLEKQFGPSGATRFVPISYKQDFALVRRIHDSFRRSPSGD